MIINIERRHIIKKLLLSGLVGNLSSFSMIKLALAMGKADIPQGMIKIQGDVTINNVPAKIGDPVLPGDVITTGVNSSAVFVNGQSAYLLRSNSHLTVDLQEKDYQPKGQGKAIDILRVLKGKMLSVFGPETFQIETPTAYVGIRGTGVYVEVEKARSYVCVCYGQVSLKPTAAIYMEEKLNTTHHDSPRYVYASAQNNNTDSTRFLQPAPFMNHTDQELIMLEAICNRQPPFVGTSPDGPDGGEGGGNIGGEGGDY